MKAIMNKMVLFAAAVAVSGGVAMAQDASVSLNHAVQAYALNSTSHIKWDMNMEPEFRLGNDTRITGLLVDCITPHYTSIMLNPPVSTVRTEEIPPSLAPVTIPSSVSNPAAHEPDFVLLRLSFP